jgi:microcystin degradation protein MlrC
MRTLLLLLTAMTASAQSSRFVVGIGGLKHESNSFNPAKTTLADFGPNTGTAGPDVLTSWRTGDTELTGYLQGSDEEGFEVFPGYVASATPKGPLTKDTFETLTERLITSLRKARKLDGILLALHGAMDCRESRG